MEREYLRGARRKARATKDYFDDDDDDDDVGAKKDDNGTISHQEQQQNDGDGADDDEVDPLDAFMMGIETQVVAERQTNKKPFEKPDVLNHEDDADAYLDEYAKQSKKQGSNNGVGGGFDDSDEEVYATAKRMEQDDNYDDGQQDAKKSMEVLVPVDHSQGKYESFRKSFYSPHPDILKMTTQEVEELRKELSVRTEGVDAPLPIRSFVQLGFDRKMLALLMKLGLEAPTAIQAQAFPVALSGRDMIGIAKTGSGKTLAFTLPMVRHVMDQRELRKDEGPIAIVLSPTRELAHQIFVQVKKFLNIYGAECAAIYGGVGKWEQIQAIRKGAEVVVATPGRLIEMIRKKTVKMNRVTFVVLDEADRMFEMGFEPQLRSVMGQIRPDRQTLMFSATFRRRIEALALDILDNPVKVMIGKIGQANEDIHQIAVVLPNDKAKWPWLMANLKRIADEGRVLIFAGSKMGCETLAKNLNTMSFPSWCLHGDKTQQERSEALAKFKSGECRILVATDVASRGLDVKDVKTVVNFDIAKNIDIHVHRIGRTGRMGLEGFEPGTAYTLVTSKESQFASQLVYNMDMSGQSVGSDLLSLAKQDPRFRRGTPAATRSMLNGGAGVSTIASVRSEETHHLTTAGETGEDDEENAKEMERWSESRRTSKADQRKGLGFSVGPGGGRGPAGRGFGVGMGRNFVKASSAAALSSSFQSAFVKSTSAARQVPPPAPARHQKPPYQGPPPPPPSQVYHQMANARVPLPPPPLRAYQQMPRPSNTEVPCSFPPPPPLSAPARPVEAPETRPKVAPTPISGEMPARSASSGEASQLQTAQMETPDPRTEREGAGAARDLFPLALERVRVRTEEEIEAQVAAGIVGVEAAIDGVVEEVRAEVEVTEGVGVTAGVEVGTVEREGGIRDRGLDRTRTRGVTVAIVSSPFHPMFNNQMQILDGAMPDNVQIDEERRKRKTIYECDFLLLPGTKSRACIFSIRLTHQSHLALLANACIYRK